MTRIMKHLTGVAFLTVTVLAARQPQTNKESHVLDIRANHPQETIEASAICQQAMAIPGRSTHLRKTADPKTLTSDLNTLMKESDEVVLVGVVWRHVSIPSPSEDSVVSYFEANVIRSWKGPHNVGDLLTFGAPFGTLNCGKYQTETETKPTHFAFVSTMSGTPELKRDTFYGPSILFLKQANGQEAKTVEGLIPASGEGLQGMFIVDIPVTGDTSHKCTTLLPNSLRWCDSYLETSEDKMLIPYTLDPLAKKYEGMSIADFLNVVRNLASDQGLDEKRP